MAPEQLILQIERDCLLKLLPDSGTANLEICFESEEGIVTITEVTKAKPKTVIVRSIYYLVSAILETNSGSFLLSGIYYFGDSSISFAVVD